MAEYIERTEEIMLAMNAGARAIENTKRYHGAIYTKDLFSENPQEIPYLQAAKVLREVSDAPAADVAQVVHGRWSDAGFGELPKHAPYGWACSVCGGISFNNEYIYCPNCGAKMDGGDDHEAD